MKRDVKIYFNPRSPCGERHLLPEVDTVRLGISIHAPRAGSDGVFVSHGAVFRHISIHTPRAGSDIGKVTKFFINIISIHAPRAGSDQSMLRVISGYCKFQSTRPSRGATGPIIGVAELIDISIHALKAGSDNRPTSRRGRSPHFNPRSPCGERPISAALYHIPSAFQSTLPARGATAKVPKNRRQLLFVFTVFGSIRRSLPSPNARTTENAVSFRHFYRAKFPRFYVHFRFAQTVIPSEHLRAHNLFSARSAEFSTHNCFPDSRTEGCPRFHP